MYNLQLKVDELNVCLSPGDVVKLGRFSTINWVVCNGWYAWGGNRPVNGWYLVREDDSNIIKPLQYTDLNDIYMIQRMV